MKKFHFEDLSTLHEVCQTTKENSTFPFPISEIALDFPTFVIMGKLVIVPTPIGNMGDITFRAIDTLRNSIFILAEDTRQTSKLLEKYEIRIPLKAFHQHNEHKVTANLAMQIAELDGNVSLVSDAGMPGISDPGFLLIRECLENHVSVDCLPGASAFLPALVKSGLPMDRFCFEGFLPHKKGRKKRLGELSDETRTMIFYESPYRLLKALNEFTEHFGEDRKASVSRELTKIYEETLNGTLAELKIHFETHPIKGEFVIVVDGKK